MGQDFHESLLFNAIKSGDAPICKAGFVAEITRKKNACPRFRNVL